jgi:cytochrome P450
MWSTSQGGYWVLTTAEDILEAFQHPEWFSSQPKGASEDLSPSRAAGGSRALIPVHLDPPEHGKYRRVLAPRFSPGAMRDIRASVEQVCEEMIDVIAGQGHCELFEEFARRFPTIVFLNLMGLPTEHAAEFLMWEDGMLHANRDMDRLQQSAASVTAYLNGVIDERADDPGDDLVSYLLGSEVDGRTMTTDEVLRTCMILFLGGLDTVTASLGLIFEYLANNETDLRRLVGDPSLIPESIEELLRLRASVNPSRTVTQDMEFAGVQMKQGDQILLSTALASRDPERFSDPTHAIFDREAKVHLAFGAGPHRCLGSHLARLELQTAVTKWLERIPEFSVLPGSETKFVGGGVIGLLQLDLTWA